LKALKNGDYSALLDIEATVTRATEEIKAGQRPYAFPSSAKDLVTADDLAIMSSMCEKR
jgi:hypothetical protein